MCVSRDLPFAQKRFCGSEGLENVVNLSDFQEASFGKAYGVLLTDGKLAGLHARAIVVINAAGEVVHNNWFLKLLTSLIMMQRFSRSKNRIRYEAR